MQTALAPMEGLVDEILRDVLTRIGGIDWCVTEFIRVSERLLPAATYRKLAPELFAGARTRAGTPMRVQFLGSDPQCLADNAAFACTLGAPVIDLNFGCPAKTVNKSRGGAVLLKEPELLHAIVREVRRTVPAAIPVTAKMRLGFTDKEGALDCARALAEGGASQIVVHARTKVEGYKPPAHWEWVARVQEAVAVPVFANGEVWTLDDWRRCREISGVDDIMLGRGLVSRPNMMSPRPGPADRRGTGGRAAAGDELGRAAAAAAGLLAAGPAQAGAALCAWAPEAVAGHAHAQLSGGGGAVRRGTPRAGLRAHRSVARRGDGVGLGAPRQAGEQCAKLAAHGAPQGSGVAPSICKRIFQALENSPGDLS
jgi:tRNA-dihydrouridine synthase C